MIINNSRLLLVQTGCRLLSVLLFCILVLITYDFDQLALFDKCGALSFKKSLHALFKLLIFEGIGVDVWQFLGEIVVGVVVDVLVLVWNSDDYVLS